MILVVRLYEERNEEMSIFKRKRKQEVRAENSESTSVLTFFGLTGELTREAASEIPTVSACINKISESVSRLPIKLYRKTSDEVEEIKSDSRLRLLNGETGDTLNTVDMWKAAISDYYLGSGAWIYVDSDGIKTQSLRYVACDSISLMKNNDPIFKAFSILVNGKSYFDFQFIRLLRKTRDGYTNIPIQLENSTILSAAYNEIKLENSVSANGGCKSGFLKAKNRLSEQALSEIRKGYKKIYDNSDKSNSKMIVLNDGLDFQEISSTSAELQLNENKRTNSMEICKIFGFPHTVLDGGASEDDNKKFIDAVISLLNQIETALDMSLLLETEKENGYYFAFDTKELTRGNVLERYKAYEIGVKNRFLQIDEIRKEEDYEPLGFNFATLGLGDVLLDTKTGQVFTPNTGNITELDKKIPCRSREEEN